MYKVEIVDNGFGISFTERKSKVVLHKADFPNVEGKTYNDVLKLVTKKVWELADKEGIRNNFIYSTYEFEFAVRRIYDTLHQ